MKKIETKRLILQSWTIKDAGQLYDYAKNPNVGPHAGWKPHETIKESKEIIRNIFHKTDAWAIKEKESGKIIGSIGFEPDKRRPGIESRELGYSLGEDYWGKGLMTEAAKAAIAFAFQELKVEIVAICTGPENKRSQKVIEKCGFTYEGTLRNAYKIYDGSIRDVLCYSILRGEYDGN